MAKVIGKRFLRWFLWHTARFDGVEARWWNRLNRWT